MGGVMTYPRLVNRNGLDGDYGTDGLGVPLDYDTLDASETHTQGRLQGIRGDLRRLERDSLSNRTTALYAALLDVPQETVKLVIDAWFRDAISAGHREWLVEHGAVNAQLPSAFGEDKQ